MRGIHARLLVLVLAAFTVISARAQLFIDGAVSIRFYDSRARVWIDHIVNLDPTTSGPLRLTLWASRHHWYPGAPRRFLGTKLIVRLLPNQVFNDLRTTIQFLVVVKSAFGR